MDIKLIVAIIGLIGVGASALIQFFLGRRAEKSKKILEIRTQAYLDFINIISEIASSAKHRDKRTLEQLQKLTQAKSRIALIGSAEVVLEMRKFFSGTNFLITDESFLAFSMLISAMRKDLTKSDSIEIGVLRDVIFGTREHAESPKDVQYIG